MIKYASRIFLNSAQYKRAYVIASVSNGMFKLNIADCHNEICLDNEIHNEENWQNAVHKLTTLHTEVTNLLAFVIENKPEPPKPKKKRTSARKPTNATNE